jgi:TonB-dependent SusC/RagA subfamily outer membrane receptor
MKLFSITLLSMGLLCLYSCGSAHSSNNGKPVTAQQIEARNNAIIPLITQIRRLPGMTLENGVPALLKGNNSIQNGARSEPLYVIDGMPVGNSFRQIQDIVQPVDVASIKVLSGADASFYGSRGASGVIVITTKRGE